MVRGKERRCAPLAVDAKKNGQKQMARGLEPGLRGGRKVQGFGLLWRREGMRDGEEYRDSMFEASIALPNSVARPISSVIMHATGMLMI